MKKIFAFIVSFCIFSMMFNMVLFADEKESVEEIRQMLLDKTIQNYETVLVPLRGDPENFNIRPTDDLDTITFGKGAALYSINFELLKKNCKAGKETVSEALKEPNRYVFPVIVSDRVVATVEVIREGNGYRVFSVCSGSMSEKIAKTVDSLQMEDAKYIDVPPIINGFLIKKPDGEQFLNLKTDTEDYEAYNEYNKAKSAGPDNLAELFLKLYEDVRAESGLTGGGGVDAAEKQPYTAIVVWGIVGLAVLSGIIIFIYRRKRI